MKRSPIRKTSKKKRGPGGKADDLFSLIVRNRVGQCERCGKRPPEVVLQCAHVITRAAKSVRCEFDNAMCLCKGCHLGFTIDRLDVSWPDFVDSKRGQGFYAAMKQRAHEGAGTKMDWDAEVRRLNVIWRELQGRAA